MTEGDAPRTLVEGTKLRLEFFETPRVSASAGCNSMSSTYALEDGTFVLDDLAITVIGCSMELVDQEDWYFGFLGSKPLIEIEGDGLVLEADGTRIEYLDQEVAAPDVELVDRTWTVETILQGGLASFTMWPVPATLRFETDGTVAVNTGCNSGEGRYQASGAKLTFSSVVVTELACDIDSSELEAAVLAVLRGTQPVTWEVTVDRLSLRGADVGLDLVASGG